MTALRTWRLDAARSDGVPVAPSCPATAKLPTAPGPTVPATVLDDVTNG